MDTPDSISDRPEDEAQHLLDKLKTLMMSTISAEGIPNASYSPFVRLEDDCFYVYVSGLSRHTDNLAATGLASLLLIEDECGAKQLFARRRLSLDCRVNLIHRDSEIWKDIIERFSNRFGDIIDVIRPLSDFKLFRLTPKSGVYVRGFGQAYRFNGAVLENFQHINSAK